ncbi:MAG: SRPBCC family protein [Acidobacteria bacterium]|nr:SRPBCC family protein [Acidobacteriota bacterium]
MKYLKWALVAVLVLLAIGFVLPDDVSIVRSTVIGAEPETIYPSLATLKTWPDWSVWNKEADPTAVFEFEGAESGVGSKWKWKGEKIEEGQLEIVESSPEKGVRYKLTMAGGFGVDGDIAFAREAGGTKVTWTDKAAFGMGPLGGWMKLLMGGILDKEQGGAQEKSLETLKKRVEGGG